MKTLKILREITEWAFGLTIAVVFGGVIYISVSLMDFSFESQLIIAAVIVAVLFAKR